jgi:hypothetical protein
MKKRTGFNLKCYFKSTPIYARLLGDTFLYVGGAAGIAILAVVQDVILARWIFGAAIAGKFLSNWAYHKENPNQPQPKAE